MTFYEEFLDSLFSSISDKHREELTMSLLTEKAPSKETEHGAWLRGVYFACREVKKVSKERESTEGQQEFLEEHSVFVNPVKTAYCPKCRKGVNVIVDGSVPNIARCECGNVFEYPISKITQDIFEQPVKTKDK